MPRDLPGLTFPGGGHDPLTLPASITRTVLFLSRLSLGGVSVDLDLRLRRTVQGRRK